MATLFSRSQTLIAEFGQQGNECPFQRHEKHARHLLPPTPAHLYEIRFGPTALHTITHSSTVMTTPCARGGTTLRTDKLFAIHTHPSSVTGLLPDKEEKCICLRVASLTFISGTILNFVRRNKDGGWISNWFSRGGGRGYKL